MKIDVLKCDKMEFSNGNEVLYKNLCSISGVDFNSSDETVFVYTKQPLVIHSEYEGKIKASNDLKSLKVVVGNQIKK